MPCSISELASLIANIETRRNRRRKYSEPIAAIAFGSFMLGLSLVLTSAIFNLAYNNRVIADFFLGLAFSIIFGTFALYVIANTILDRRIRRLENDELAAFHAFKTSSHLSNFLKADSQQRDLKNARNSLRSLGFTLNQKWGIRERVKNGKFSEADHIINPIVKIFAILNSVKLAIESEDKEQITNCLQFLNALACYYTNPTDESLKDIFEAKRPTPTIKENLFANLDALKLPIVKHSIIYGVVVISIGALVYSVAISNNVAPAQGIVIALAIIGIITAAYFGLPRLAANQK